MTYTIGGKDYELNYTFNSFKSMENLDFNEMNDLSSKPFKMIKILGVLLAGALNSTRSKKYSDKQIDDILEQASNEGILVELFEKLTELLTDTGFFKNLQK